MVKCIAGTESQSHVRGSRKCHYAHEFKRIYPVSISHHKHQYLKMLGHTPAIQAFSLGKGRPATMKKLPLERCAEPAAALPALPR